jgi:hypothetical protein
MRLSFASLAVSALLFHTSIAATIHRRDVLNDALKGAEARKASAASASAVAAASPSSPAAAAAAAASVPSAVAAPLAGVKSTASGFTTDVTSRLTSLGFLSTAVNAVANNGGCWIGSDGPNTNLVKNGASESIVVVVWGPMGSWMTNPSMQPSISVGLAPGQSVTISCGDVTGGMAAIYGNTKLSPFGQIDQTWVEFTFGQYGTVDVSREVNMSGNPVSVVGDKCTTDMNTCVFTCLAGNTCMTLGSYKLNNCSPANGGQSDLLGQNGGCLMGPNAKLTTTFS